MPLTLELNQPRIKSIGSQMNSLMGLLEKIEAYRGDSKVEFDFANITFVQPIFLSCISALILRLRTQGFRVVLTNRSDNIAAHFRTIYFPNGLRLDQNKNWKGKLRRYRGKEYIPLIYFQARPLERESFLRDNVLSMVYTLLRDNCSLPVNVYSAVIYLISEMTDNIVDHSGQSRGWISANYNSRDKYLEICLVDCGHGLLRTYLNNGVEIETHTEAINKALLGLSTKADKERGFGIHTSNNMTVKGLKGVFAMFTGNSLLINNKIVELPVNWRGTIVALRIPVKAWNFKVIEYVE